MGRCFFKPVVVVTDNTVGGLITLVLFLSVAVVVVVGVVIVVVNIRGSIGPWTTLV